MLDMKAEVRWVRLFAKSKGGAASTIASLAFEWLFGPFLRVL